jgi:class 3 adenylate cyclase
VLAATISHWEDAERHFNDAIAKNIEIGARPWLAQTQYEYASMLLSRNEPGDREKALGFLTHALDTAGATGMQALIERCLALKLRAQGVDHASLLTSIDAVAAAVEVEQPDLRSHAAPDGTVTIMFSDIEGSTQANERLGDQRWMELLRTHNALVRDAVHAHGGFEVKSQGDGFMVAFGSARRALQCAIAIQRALAEQNATAEETVRVRIGLHTGEAVREADDFYGRHVVLASRIASQAVGGEILVSALLKELTQGGGEFTFDEGRQAELKGLAGTQLMFAAAAP